MLEDNIAALATPPGESGIAVIRLSGPDSINLIASAFRPVHGPGLSERRSHTLTLGWLLNADGQPLDQVLAGIMRAPRSYTAENVAELNCHGGLLAVRACLERCLELGFRLAEPGEFTHRAFLNGRLDLSQAEAVIDIIRAQSDTALQLSVQQLAGQLSGCVQTLEYDLVGVQAALLASIDFPEDVGELDVPAATASLQSINEKIELLLRASARTEIYRQGINLTICGKPNVGKSSLLNRLLLQDKAIVTEIPGTTRDIVEELIHIAGLPVHLMDTAGIRTTEDQVEKIGVARSKQAIALADAIIFVLDKAAGITAADLEVYREIRHPEKVIFLLNKDDLTHKDITDQEIYAHFPQAKIIRASVKEDYGIEELEAAIIELITNDQSHAADLRIWVNARQKDALQRCQAEIQAIQTSLSHTTLDCLAVELDTALDCLGEITGRSLKEEVITRIFQDFCIGK